MPQSPDPLEQRLQLAMSARLKLAQLPRWVHGLALGGTGIVFLIALFIFLTLRDDAVWENWVSADEFRNPEYGERIFPDSVFRTRMNTWSNIVYVCLGFYALALSIFDWKRDLPLNRGYLMVAPMLTALFGMACIYLGIGSAFFHASLTRYGQQCDVGGMYATLICLVSFVVGSWLPRMRVPKTRLNLPTWPILAVLVVTSSSYFTYYKWDYSFSEISGYLSGILILFAGISTITPGKYLQFRWFAAGILVLILGSWIRELDIADRFTDPDSILQGHAIWHLLTCGMYVFLLMYFRSEERE